MIRSMPPRPSPDTFAEALLRWLWRAWCGLLLAGLGLSAAAAVPATPPVDLATQGMEPVQLVASMQVLKQVGDDADADTEASAADVLHQPGWLPATDRNRNSAWVPATVWLTGVVHNSSAEPLTRWIVVTPRRIREVSLAVFEPGSPLSLSSLASRPERITRTVEPAFAVTLPPGGSLRLVVRAQDVTIPTATVEAWAPEAYGDALRWTLVREAIWLTIWLLMVGVLLWTKDLVNLLLAGWLGSVQLFQTSFQGLLVPSVWPGIAEGLVPAFLIAGALSVCFSTLASRTLLNIGRDGVWAWALGGLNALALLSACATLFVENSVLPRAAVTVLGLAIALVWPVAAWCTPLPQRPGAQALRWAFLLCWLNLLVSVLLVRYGYSVPFAGLTLLGILVIHARVRATTAATDRQFHTHLALHDALTQLPNRVRGRQVLEQAIHRATARPSERVGLLCLDLDRFKHVNDTYGHAAGDALLRAVAQRLQACLGPGDTACRLSGDEFMAVLPGVTSHAQVVARCEAVLAQFTQPFDIEGVQLFISSSVGAAVFPEHAVDAESLMRHADTALFECKRGGANQHRLFSPDMNARLTAYVNTRTALHLALEQQEFELYYQPQIRLEDGALVGVEALVRWNRPGQALNQPGEFIPVAEESGLIAQIGAWVIHEACRQAAEWHRDGLHELKVAVNVSALQFRSGTLVQDVTDALAASALPPHCLELEVTETVLMGKEAVALHTVQQLKALGVSLSIDDFGTGYSNLAYLHRFGFDRLKIDRSFIRRLGHGAEEQAIVRAILQMARHLNLRTTAEGVENAETAQRLAHLGCDEAQGYHYTQPLAAAALDRWRKGFQPLPAAA